MITLDMLREMFADMKTRYNWNVDGNLLWGYFFTDPDPKKLERVADYLTQAGYRFVDIFRMDDPDKELYLLHVEKVEHHTPETLDRRNQEFYSLAGMFDLASYDGMDVGPPA